LDELPSSPGRSCWFPTILTWSSSVATDHCWSAAMLRTSPILLTRRLAQIRNTSYPIAMRRQGLWGGQFPQYSLRQATQFRNIGIYVCAATAALVVCHHWNPAVLLDARTGLLESTRGPPFLQGLSYVRQALSNCHCSGARDKSGIPTDYSP
jgi:hypothetical protein